VCHLACHDWATWHTISFVIFFNGKLTEGLKAKVLQSAGTNAKKKKSRDQCQNWAKVQGLNTHLSQKKLTQFNKESKTLILIHFNNIYIK
jgi:hypothetical protein